MDNKEIEKKICEVLDKIRPYLENDGGSVKFNRYENGVAYVTLVVLVQIVLWPLLH